MSLTLVHLPYELRPVTEPVLYEKLRRYASVMSATEYMHLFSHSLFKQ